MHFQSGKRVIIKNRKRTSEFGESGAESSGLDDSLLFLLGVELALELPAVSSPGEDGGVSVEADGEEGVV